MKAELKAKWVDALRSGKYVQGTGVLRAKNETFCCLGVLCDLVGNGLWSSKTIDCATTVGNEDLVIPAFLFRFDSDSESWAEPPAALRHQVALPLDAQSRLIDKNDNGYTFAQIADWIEVNVGVEHE